MEACVRHLRVHKENPTVSAPFLLIQDTLQALGQQAICFEVTTRLLLPPTSELLLVVMPNYYCQIAGDTSTTAICCAESSAANADIGVGLGSATSVLLHFRVQPHTRA